MKMKRIKGRNFTDRETIIFLDVIEPYMKILENKKTDGASVREKNLVWDCIYKKFNSCSHYERTVGQLKNYYDNFKRKARKNSISKQENRDETNIDGIITRRLDENEARLLVLLKHAEPVHNSYRPSREYQERIICSASETSETIENKVLEPVVLTHLPSEKIENNIPSHERIEEEDSLNAPTSCQEVASRNDDHSGNQFNHLDDYSGREHQEIEISNIEVEYSKIKLELKKIELKRAQRDMEEKDELFILTKKKYLNELIIQENEIRKQQLDIKKKEYELKMLQ